MDDIGSLNRPVVIQARDQSAVDSFGQPVDNWTTFASVRAAILFVSGVRVGIESVRGGALASNPPQTIRIRFRTDITAAMRVVDGSTIYNIQSVLPNMATKKVTDLVCEVQRG